MRGCAGAGLGIEKPKLTLGPPVAEAAAPDALAPDAAALGGKFGIGRLRGIASSKPRRGATRLRMASEASSRRDTIGEATGRSEEHTSELQSLMRISYAVFCLKKKNK